MIIRDFNYTIQSYNKSYIIPVKEDSVVRFKVRTAVVGDGRVIDGYLFRIDGEIVSAYIITLPPAFLAALPIV